MKATTARDISVGGPGLAAEAIRAGLVDECHLFVAPVIIGRGTPAFADDAHIDLELQDARQLDGGTMYLRYRTGN